VLPSPVRVVAARREFLLASIRAGYQLFHERGPNQALRDNERIVAKCFKEFLEHVGLFGIPRDPIHLSL
jgi:hypothetical protein